MKYARMPIEIESPEQIGYDTIACNLAESSVHDATFHSLHLNLNDLVLAYGHHVGKPELRELIAASYPTITADDILITSGAVSALFIVATTLLGKSDHLLVMHPNYATNLETPKAIGCEIDFIALTFEKGFETDIATIEALIKPNTRCISITSPHNPTGTIISEPFLLQLVQLVEKHKCYLLVDETYRDLTPAHQLPLAATLSSRVISVSSVSKAYGLPGIRIGWLISKDKQLQETFLAAKEQIILCNSVIDEEIAYQFILQKEQFLPAIQQKIANHFSILKNWMDTQQHLEWVVPKAGVVCFPRVKKKYDVTMDHFYEHLYGHYKTVVGPGHWFGMDKRYMRIGYGWPSTEMLNNGLQNISLTLDKYIR